MLTSYIPVISQYRTEEDLFKKEEKKAKLLKETIPFYLNKFEKTVGENGGYAVGSTVSHCPTGFDIKIFTIRVKTSETTIKRGLYRVSYGNYREESFLC